MLWLGLPTEILYSRHVGLYSLCMNYFERIIISWLSIYSPEAFVFNTPCLGAKRQVWVGLLVSFYIQYKNFRSFQSHDEELKGLQQRLVTLSSKMVSLQIYKKETRKNNWDPLTEEKERCVEIWKRMHISYNKEL